MKSFLLILITAFAVSLNSCSASQNKNSSTNLTAENFDEKMKQLPDAPVVDVRTPEEFAKGHLVNAKNIDWRGNDFDKQVEALDKSKPVLVYCLSGGRSSEAAEKMRSEGFKEVYELNGGIMKWRAANLPETTNPASAGMSKEQFDALLNSDKTILIDFYADWCAPCKKMKPYLDEINTTMADKVRVIRINADDNQALVKALKIDALPVLQVYKTKALNWTHSGFIDKDSVLMQLK